MLAGGVELRQDVILRVDRLLETKPPISSAGEERGLGRSWESFSTYHHLVKFMFMARFRSKLKGRCCKVRGLLIHIPAVCWVPRTLVALAEVLSSVVHDKSHGDLTTRMMVWRLGIKT